MNGKTSKIWRFSLNQRVINWRAAEALGAIVRESYRGKMTYERYAKKIGVSRKVMNDVAIGEGHRCSRLELIDLVEKLDLSNEKRQKAKHFVDVLTGYKTAQNIVPV
ncbi:MAG: hypothetical protein WAX85_03070 [Minisyncoccia bacterium]